MPLAVASQGVLQKMARIRHAQELVFFFENEADDLGNAGSDVGAIGHIKAFDLTSAHFLGLVSACNGACPQ